MTRDERSTEVSRFKDARNSGWNSQAPVFNWSTPRANKKAGISRLNAIYDNFLAGVKADVTRQRARIVEAHTVAVGERRHTAEKNPDCYRRLAAYLQVSRQRAGHQLE